MSEIAIRVEDLWKQYRLGQKKSTSIKDTLRNLFKPADEAGFFWALREMDFEIKRGEAVGVIGRNGAGKSTLLKVLSKITYPTKGRIEINGRVSSLLEVGTGFHPELSGRQNVYLNGTILGMTRKEIQSKFDEIVAFSGVEKFIDTPVKHYSSGMKVRLAFSVAAHLEPEILIIDEVLAVGDAEFQKKCLGKMEDVTGEGRTVLFVSHNMGAVESLCSRAILLEGGKQLLDSYDVSYVIGQYFAKGAPRDSKICKLGSLELEPFSNEELVLKEFYLSGSDGEILPDVVVHGSAININVALSCHRSDSSLNIGFVLYHENKRILWSWAKDISRFELESGKHSSLTVQIPAGFLNNGNYSVELVGVLHNVKSLIKIGEGPVLKFEVVEGSKSVILSPKLDWQQSYIDKK